jgi:hypothetical protein
MAAITAVATELRRLVRDPANHGFVLGHIFRFLFTGYLLVGSWFQIRRSSYAMSLTPAKNESCGGSLVVNPAQQGLLTRGLGNRTDGERREVGKIAKSWGRKRRTMRGLK